MAMSEHAGLWKESLEQFQKVMETSAPYLKTWAESLEFFQQIMATNQSYLKPWTDFMEQYQKMIDTSFRPHSDRASKE